MKKPTISATAKALVATDIEKRIARQGLQPSTVSLSRACTELVEVSKARKPVKTQCIASQVTSQLIHQ